MTRSITITLEGVPDIALRKNRGSTGHWDRQKAAKAMRETSYILVLEQIADEWPGGPHFAKASILITQHYCGKPLDHPGLASATSPAVDAFVDANVIEDDQPVKFITDYHLAYVREKHKSERRVTVTLEEAENGG